jgi:hypothetical protein
LKGVFVNQKKVESKDLADAQLGAAGRPFLVNGVARRAEVGNHRDWILPRTPRPETAGLGAEARLILGEAWTRTGQLEHASIAAFARFTLELLAFGAPADLVARASAAMADETAHALSAFSLASVYAGRSIGPEQLPVADAIGGCDLDEAIHTTFVEGCIGETVAALEASMARDHTSDRAVRAVLARIAEDEASHAELAFRFLQWALPRTQTRPLDRLSAVLDAAIERAAREADAAAVESSIAAQLLEHGVLPEARRSALRHAALRDVVAPCLHSLRDGHWQNRDLFGRLDNRAERVA